MDIRHKALNGIDLAGKRILEIGPLNRPLVPRSDAYIVFYADHCSTDELRRKYAGNPDVPPDDICSVDYDLSQISIIEAADKAGGFDVIVASHVVEHVPDLVGWMKEVECALRQGGILALVVPDKRYTFDTFRRETELWMVDEAAQEGRTRPSLRQILEHFVNIVAADAPALWKDPESRHEFRPQITATAIEGLFSVYRSGDYIDAHCWIVTPETFRKIMRHVSDRYDVGLTEHRFEDTNRGQLEFYVQYKKERRGGSASRNSLAAWLRWIGLVLKPPVSNARSR
jgi:SAM-dependent methyltransferase